MRVDLQPFEEKYRSNPDPWGFSTSDYEQRKYAITIASLPRQRYARCFEPGCSVGVLTERLARIADHVVATDASSTAVAAAVRRLCGVGHVNVSLAIVPDEWPAGRFDLIVFSELGYYWDADELPDVAARLSSSLDDHGHLVAVHWLGESPDHLLQGAAVHDIMSEVFGRPVVRHIDADFILDVWERA